MKSRQVCCCGARIWCHVIGYFTLILSSVEIVSCLSGLRKLSSGERAESAEEIELQSNFSSIFGEEYHLLFYLERMIFKSVILHTVMSLYTFIHSAILCVGAYLEKRIYLTIWLVMEIPLIFIAGISLLMLMVATVLAVSNSAPFYTLLHLPILALFSCLTLFYTRVVKIHWEELKV